eukprot:ctg_372.g238
MGGTGTAAATDAKYKVGRNERRRPRTLAKRPCSWPTRFPESVSLGATDLPRCSQRSVKRVDNASREAIAAPERRSCGQRRARTGNAEHRGGQTPGQRVGWCYGSVLGPFGQAGRVELDAVSRVPPHGDNAIHSSTPNTHDDTSSLAPSFFGAAVGPLECSPPPSGARAGVRGVRRGRAERHLSGGDAARIPKRVGQLLPLRLGAGAGGLHRVLFCAACGARRGPLRGEHVRVPRVAERGAQGARGPHRGLHPGPGALPSGGQAAGAHGDARARAGVECRPGQSVAPARVHRVGAGAAGVDASLADAASAPHVPDETAAAAITSGGRECATGVHVTERGAASAGRVGDIYVQPSGQ